MILTDEKLTKLPRKYYSEDLDVSRWDMVETELNKLLDMEINSAEDLLTLIKQFSELDKILRNEYAWRYIDMTRYADQEEYAQKFNDFFANVISGVSSYDFKIKKKFYASEYRKDLSEEDYGHLNRIISNHIELFREENIPLQVQEQELASKYGAIASKMTVTYNGEEKTLQQMSVYLQDNDRQVREETFKMVIKRLNEDAEELDHLFDEMKAVRVQMAKNAGFDNYRDYMHQAKGRFAYTPDDIHKFHDSVEKVVIPFLRELNKERQEQLGVDTLRPWDLDVNIDGKTLRPFASVDEFVDKGIEVLAQVNREFGIRLNKMKNSSFLDLDNRKGKAPGGYCTSIPEHGASFIFMNAVGLHSDVNTLVHESGHSMHAFSLASEPISQYASTPHEIAELASMSMEFLTMDHWNIYYSDPEDMKKAKKEQLENTLKFLPWCMIVDAFQQWIYTNPDHTPEERYEYFASLMDRFNPGVDWSGLDMEKRIRWMRQLHIFEVPFYYIEYGIAQLGALAVYKNYKENKDQAIASYEQFLKLGYSKPMDKIYEAAGIRFDFSNDYISEIVEFVKDELANL